MPETPPTERQYAIRRKLVAYRMRPLTPFGRVLAFVLGVVLFVAAFLVSLVIFSMLLTAVLLLIVYAWLVSRSVRRKNKDVIQ